MERTLQAVGYQIAYSRKPGQVLKLAVLSQLVFACSQNLSTPASPDMSDLVHNAQSDILNVDDLYEMEQAFRVVSGRNFVTFEPGKASLSSAARLTLERQALWLKDNPEVRAHIIGFADRGGSAGMNADLAARRAQVVRDYLLSNKLSSSQLTIVTLETLPKHASLYEIVGRALTVIVG